MTEPVMPVERQRNAAMEARQGTRNPFVDQPELGNQL